MADIPVINRGRTSRFVAGRLVPPGETRILPEEAVPADLRPGRGTPSEPAPDLEADPLLGLLDRPIKEIKPALEGLSIEDLRRLRDAEEAGNTRSTLMAFLDEEIMRQAAEAELSPFREELLQLGTEELEALKETYAEDEARLGLIEEEEQRRAAGDEDAFREELVGLSEEELLGQMEEHKDDDAKLALVNEEIQRRGESGAEGGAESKEGGGG